MSIIKSMSAVLLIIVFGILFLLAMTYLFNVGLLFTSSSDKVFSGERNQIYDNGQERGQYTIYNSNTETISNFLIFLNEFKSVFLVILMGSFLFMLFLANKTGLFMKIKEVISK